MAANGTGNTVTIDAYGNTETIIFCDLDEVHLAALTCSTDKVPVIVSPATCTHCQIARCIKWEDAHRYAAWNPQLDTTGAADFHPEPAPSK